MTGINRNYLTKKEKFLLEVLKHKNSLRVKKLINMYNDIGEVEAFKVCKKNKIADIAAYSLKQAKISLPKYWALEYENTKNLISSYMIELDRIASLFKKNGIIIVALKNSGICRGLYRIPGASPMGDLDVLVDISDFEKAHKLLLLEGYKFKFRSELEENDIKKAKISGGAEYLAILKDGNELWFELQWRPVAGRWIQKHQEPEAKDLISRSKSIPGSDVRILSPEDNLLQVCLHTAKHSYVRSPGFRLHTDVDRIINETKINWETFIYQVEKLEVKTACYFSLYFAKTLLNTKIPNNILKKLSPNLFKRTILLLWIKKVGLFEPDSKKWGKIGYIIFVSLLYDSISSFKKALFPKIKSSDGAIIIWWKAFPYHFKRIYDLLFRRSLVK